MVSQNFIVGRWSLAHCQISTLTNYRIIKIITLFNKNTEKVAVVHPLGSDGTAHYRINKLPH